MFGNVLNCTETPGGKRLGLVYVSSGVRQKGKPGMQCRVAPLLYGSSDFIGLSSFISGEGFYDCSINPRAPYKAYSNFNLKIVDSTDYRATAQITGDYPILMLPRFKIDLNGDITDTKDFTTGMHVVYGVWTSTPIDTTEYYYWKLEEVQFRLYTIDSQTQSKVYTGQIINDLWYVLYQRPGLVKDNHSYMLAWDKYVVSPQYSDTALSIYSRFTDDTHGYMKEQQSDYVYKFKSVSYKYDHYTQSHPNYGHVDHRLTSIDITFDSAVTLLAGKTYCFYKVTPANVIQGTGRLQPPITPSFYSGAMPGRVEVLTGSEDPQSTFSIQPSSLTYTPIGGSVYTQLYADVYTDTWANHPSMAILPGRFEEWFTITATQNETVQTIHIECDRYGQNIT